MASASGSVCASTGASPAPASHDTLVGTSQSQSAPKPPRPTTGNETARDPAIDGGLANVIHLDGVEESLEPAAKKRRDKKTTSEVWDYFTKTTVEKKGDKGNIEVEVWAKCKKCAFKTRGESNRGTTVFWNHLKNKHNLVRGQQELHLQSGGNSTVVQNFKFDPDDSLKKFYKAVIMHDYPFKMVDHEFFVDFIKSLRPHFAFKCRTTTRNDTMKIYSDEKKMLFDQLKLLSCRFSATMDMWTSNQNKGYMCITIHWIDDNWGMQKRIICLPHVKGRHGGELLAHEFVKGVMDWHLEQRLFSLTLDNAAANNKCVVAVVKELNDLAKIRKSPPLICGGVFFHVRCLCHILNLVAQNGLTVISKSVKNIRAIIVIVKNSTLQWEEFQKCADFFGLDNKSGLPLDVATRWNSTYDMLSHALYYRSAFERLVYLHKDKYSHCAPTSDEWDMAESFCKCLKIFNDATVLFSGCQYPTANLFWWKFCEIKLALREWCGDANITIASMAEAMQKKYDKYWKRTNIALAVACFLDPRYKKKLVEYFMLKIYKERALSEVSRFMDVVKQLFQAYLNSALESTQYVPPPEPSAANTLGVNSDIEDFLYKDEDAANRDEISELDVYMKEKIFRWVDPCGKGAQFDVLSWWKSNQVKYPVLSRLARDVLAVQVSTVASESAFSSSGRIVSKFRSSLDPEAVEALVCTKDWMLASSKGKIDTS
ncbi:hypothetical protein BS78_K242300 [Paspalum vaginatum]|uniref:BED-type domain-containing protein n=1 Tax=Paspalum vaginatum TaxID=158149 RepID=A0A9W7X7I3_9POAL|nr:hypothetical protein BS78_K242300 [Paspalum vaginatum]